MTDRTRNVIVGLTVLGAFVALAGMVILFAKLPGFLRGGREIKILIESTAGIRTGHEVHMHGMRVGYISDIEFYNVDDPQRRIIMTARIEREVSIPKDTVCYVTRPAWIGNPRVTLVTDQQRYYERRPALGEDVIYGAIQSSDPFAEIKESLSNVLTVTEDLVDIMGPANAGDLPPEEAGLRGATIRLNRALDEIQALASSSREHVDVLAGKLANDADELSLLLTALQRVAAKIDSGEGTAGRLINDPRLYREFVETAEQMTLLMTDMRELVQQWKDQGVTVRAR